MFELLHGDCLDLMHTIPDGSIDAIICDPPYGTTACKWDTVIPFEPMWEQLKRIIKPNGAIALFGSEPFSSLLRVSNLKMYKYDWVWDKNNCTDFVNSHHKPMSAFENILIFSTGGCAPASKSKMPYNPQGLFEINLNKTRSPNSIGKHMNVTKNNMLSKKHTYVQKFTNYQKDIISINKDKLKIHPTQKPVALMEYLIRTYTNEGDTVLDFTMGSGSTGVACVRTNREFVGIERDDKYFEIAQKRIQEEIDKPKQLELLP